MKYSVIPVIGLEIERDFFHRENGTLLWGLVNPKSYSSFESIVEDSTRLIKEIKMIDARLKPNCFLFAFNPEIEDDIWNDDRPEMVLSCLSLLIYKHLDNKLNNGIAPIFRKRFMELADLPISFTKNKISSIGHTSKIDMYSWDPIKLTNVDFQLLVDRSKGIYKSILKYQKVSSKKSLLLPYIRIFDNANIGGLITSALMVIERIVLLEGESWKVLKQKLNFIFPGEKTEIDNLLKDRNEYVHSGHLPIGVSNAIYGLAKSAYLVNLNEDFRSNFPDMKFENYLDLKFRESKLEIPLGIEFKI